jgi:hypothetical protein
VVAARAAAFEPGWTDLPRPFTSDRATVRQISDTFVRAVRDLVGGDQHKPFVTPRPVGLASRSSTDAGTPATPRVHPPAPVLVRVALLDLPPPAAA